MDTNDPAESPFAALTRQLQGFGRVLRINTSSIGHAGMNGDFHHDLKDDSNVSAFHRLPQEMHDSLLVSILGIASIAPEVWKVDYVALDKQREAKKRKQ